MVNFRNLVLVLLLVTVAAPLLLYTDTLSTFKTPSSRSDFLEDVTALTFKADATRLNLLPQDTPATIRGPVGVVYSEDSADSSNGFATSLLAKDLPLSATREHISARVLSTTGVDDQSQTENSIKQVTDPATGTDKQNGRRHGRHSSNGGSKNMVDEKDTKNVGSEEQKGNLMMPDARVKHLKDQLIRAKVYLSLPAAKANSHFVRELRLRIKEIQRTLGDASKDSDLPKNAYEKLRAMEQTLAKGKQIQDDCATVVKKLRAMLHSTEEQLRVHKKQTMFLTQLTAKTIPKGLHCLPLRLTAEYYALSSSQKPFPDQGKLEDPHLYHYALFSDNILAASVVVNSTITNAKHPSKHVFHIVTDRLNYAAMKMWFLANPPGQASIQVQNVEEFTWLNSSYSPVLRQLGSQSMIDYYFRSHHANSDSNLKFRNPKYLSILNHLRFYLPEIFPKLNKVLFLDDDIVVQKDLSSLWSLDLKGVREGQEKEKDQIRRKFQSRETMAEPETGPKVGAPREVDLNANDLQVESLARFAVDEHNKKENAGLQLKRILGAKTQVVAGTMHHLTLEVADGETKKVYEAKVWEKTWENLKQLEGFKHLHDVPSDA